MSAKEIKLPYGSISDKKLIMHFCAYDMDLPVIAAGICDRMDVFKELGVSFAGFGTDLSQKITDQSPATVKCFFEYIGTGPDADVILKRVYHLVWAGIVENFPELDVWAAAKADLSNLTIAQAELLRARHGE